MNSQQFYTSLNDLYQECFSSDQSDEAIIRQTLKKFSETQSFNRLSAYSFESQEQYQSFNHSLVEIEGVVVDVLEPKMMIARINATPANHFRLFSYLCPEQEEIQFQLMEEAKFADLTRVIILIDTANLGISQSIWDDLCCDKKIKIQNSKIPILIEAILPRENFLIGSKLKLFGYLYTKSIPEKQEAIDHQDELTKEFYISNSLYNLILIDCQPVDNGANLTSEILLANPKHHTYLNLLKRIHFEIKAITNDDLASQLILFALMTPKTNDSSECELNYFNLNVFNFTQEKYDSFLKLMTQIQLSCQFITINKETLSKKLISEKNHEYEVLELNTLHPGLADSILINEIPVESSKLNEAETLNLITLSQIIQNQLIYVKYFDQNFLNFHFDNSIITFSKTRSIFKSKLKICCKPEPEITTSSNFSDINGCDTHEMMQFFKNWVKIVTINETDLSLIQTDFVQTRKQNPKFDSEQFSFLIVLAKYISAWNLSPTINFETYLNAKMIIQEIADREKLYLDKTK